MYQDMEQWFWENGQASDGFRELAETIEARRIRRAQANRDELLQLGRCVRKTTRTTMG
jgi:hypothetical protein